MTVGTARNVTIFFGLCGLAMALSGHVWPGAFVMAVAVMALVVQEIIYSLKANINDCGCVADHEGNGLGEEASYCF